MSEHVVEQGECISTITLAHGFADWKKIWNDPANEALRKLRKNPNVLHVGDVIQIPDKEPKAHPVVTDGKHTFKVKRPRTRLKLVMKDNDEPIAGEAFRIEVGKKVIEGTTSSAGEIDVEIPADETEGTLVFTKRDESFTLMLGHLDPVDEPTGVQARLRQLCFYVGAVDGDLGPYTQAAIERFQGVEGLPRTGEMDDETRDALLKAYGC
jgi:Putative peptidoglycan binding domain